MSKSYEKVNYLLRLKKQIERKMIIETIQQLSSVVDISTYRYFGFGSPYFADFILFHKYLNVSSMTSIDNKREDETRFLFNKPFDFVIFKIYDSHTYLGKELNWAEKLFIWLDYDHLLDIEVVSDVCLVASKSMPLNIFLVTVEAEPQFKEDQDIVEFKEIFESYIPPEIKLTEIKHNFTETLRRIFKAGIDEGLKTQNQIKFLQLFNLVYEDTKKMYTFGGIFYRGGIDADIRSRVSKLHYISHDSRLVEIDCPILTPKEKFHLDSCVKAGNICEDSENSTGLKREDMESYGRFYKYYPQFFESIY